MDLSKPLAYRMSPKTLDDYVGQEHILGRDKILYRTIKADRLSSIILWGPPGCGKTSLARVISNTTKYKFIKINAVTSGVSDIKNAVETAQNVLLNPSGKCILFIDEIHRFNKLQQDALLPFVENGTVIIRLACGRCCGRNRIDMKRILVTGGAGFIGSHLCKKLVEEGNEVICADNLFTGSKRNIRALSDYDNFEFLRADITKELYVEKLTEMGVIR